jgi:two-component system invasion response regulator UvrY
MKTKETQSVLIVDDHSSIAFLIGEFIRGLPGFSLSGLACDAASALAALREQPVDVVLLDLGLPDGNGLDLLSEIRAIAPAAKILIFSALISPHTLREAIRQQVAGFMEKSAPLEQLEGALRQVVAGKVALGPAAGTILSEILRGNMGVSELAARQVEILRLLAAGNSVKEIASRLGLSIPGVYKSIGRMKEKTGSRTAMELVLKARNKGLVKSPDDQFRVSPLAP